MIHFYAFKGKEYSVAYDVIVSERVQSEINKRLKDKELIRRFYKRLRKLERDPTSHGTSEETPCRDLGDIFREKVEGVI